MARLILCKDCYERMKANADRYGEYCKGVRGTALRLFICDSQGEEIKEGAPCVATDLHPVEPKYIEPWITEFINIEPTAGL